MQEDPFAKYIYGDSSRLFLNTELGCVSACSYCYLPTEGFSIDSSWIEVPRMTARQILDRLEKDVRVRRGPEGTIFSIGCFSECWDHRSRKETILLILGLLPYGNPIQMATKRKISKHDLSEIVVHPHWRGQLHIYVSSATVKNWAGFERGTTPPEHRFESFKECRDAGVQSFLYIKPVLPNVTISDIAVYGAVMESNFVGAIVGETFEEGKCGDKSPISESLRVVAHSDVDKIRKGLAVYGKVYASSIGTLRQMETNYD